MGDFNETYRPMPRVAAVIREQAWVVTGGLWCIMVAYLFWEQRWGAHRTKEFLDTNMPHWDE